MVQRQFCRQQKKKKKKLTKLLYSQILETKYLEDYLLKILSLNFWLFFYQKVSVSVLLKNFQYTLSI